MVYNAQLAAVAVAAQAELERGEWGGGASGGLPCIEEQCGGISSNGKEEEEEEERRACVRVCRCAPPWYRHAEYVRVCRDSACVRHAGGRGKYSRQDIQIS